MLKFGGTRPDAAKSARSEFVRWCDCGNQVDTHSNGDSGKGINATDVTARCTVQQRPTFSRETILKMSEKLFSEHFLTLKLESDHPDIQLADIVVYV